MAAVVVEAAVVASAELPGALVVAALVAALRALVDDAAAVVVGAWLKSVAAADAVRPVAAVESEPDKW